MKNKALMFLAAAAVFSLFLSCTSVPYSRWKSSAGKVISLVNSGGGKLLSDITASPFLFDREIIVLEKDIAMIWKNISETGFSFGDAVEVESIEAGPSDYSYFGDTMEVRTWFEKYLPEEASIVKIESGSDQYLFILGGRKWVKEKEEAPAFGFGIYKRVGAFSFSVHTEEEKEVNKSYPMIYGFTGPVKGGR